MDDTNKPKEFQVNNKSVKDRIGDLDSFLDKYNSSVGLGKINVNNEAQKYLELTYEELNKYDEEECNIASYTIEKYALYLQKETNRNQAKCNWAINNIEKIVAKIGSNYGDKFTKYEMRRQIIIEDNEFANALQAIVLETSAKNTELSFIVKNLSSISNTLKSLAKSKTQSYRGM